MKPGQRATRLLLVLSLVIYHQDVFAQANNSTEPLAILEVGGAPSWSATDSEKAVSPTVAVEITPIEHWLEIEIGTTPTFNHRLTTWATDLLLKKPWTLSSKVEFMFGVGPDWIRTRSSGTITNSIGGQVALDFMFWPSAKRRLGWYLEPAYEHDFGRGHDNSIGISGGLLITIPRRARASSN